MRRDYPKLDTVTPYRESIGFFADALHFSVCTFARFFSPPSLIPSLSFLSLYTITLIELIFVVT